MASQSALCLQAISNEHMRSLALVVVACWLACALASVHRYDKERFCQLAGQPVFVSSGGTEGLFASSQVWSRS